jgi:hypothetical protein
MFEIIFSVVNMNHIFHDTLNLQLLLIFNSFECFIVEVFIKEKEGGRCFFAHYKHYIGKSILNGVLKDQS